MVNSKGGACAKHTRHGSNESIGERQQAGEIYLHQLVGACARVRACVTEATPM